MITLSAGEIEGEITFLYPPSVTVFDFKGLDNVMKINNNNNNNNNIILFGVGKIINFLMF